MIQPRTLMLGIIQRGTRTVIQRFVISYPQKLKTTFVLEQSLNHPTSASFLGIFERKGQELNLEYLFTIKKMKHNTVQVKTLLVEHEDNIVGMLNVLGIKLYDTCISNISANLISHLYMMWSSTCALFERKYPILSPLLIYNISTNNEV